MSELKTYTLRGVPVLVFIVVVLSGLMAWGYVLGTALVRWIG